jgi:hypothetical protein
MNNNPLYRLPVAARSSIAGNIEYPCYRLFRNRIRSKVADRAPFLQVDCQVFAGYGPGSRTEGDLSSGRTFRSRAWDGQYASQCPHWMHLPAFSSSTRGRVFSSAGSMIAIGQMREQIPQRVQKSWSTSIVDIFSRNEVLFLEEIIIPCSEERQNPPLFTIF